MADQQTVTIVLETKAQGAGVKQTVDGLSSVRGAVESLASKLLGAKALITGALAGLTAAVTGGVIGAGIKKAIETADEFHKVAQKAGQDVATFSALAGGNIEKAEALVVPMRLLAQWMRTTGQTGKDLTQVFLDQADVISKTTDQGEKLRLTQERFGRSGQEIIPILNKGRQGLLDMMETARLFGLVIGEKFAQQAYEFEKNIGLIRSFATGLFNRIAEAVLPQLLAVTNQIVAWMRGNAQQIGQFAQDAVNVFITAWKVGKLFDLLSLTIEAAVDEGGRAGVSAFVFGMKAGLSKLFSVDFLIYAAQAGRMLASLLLAAVQVPVAALSAGFETVAFGFYNLMVGLNVKAAAATLEAFTKVYNFLAPMVPGLQIMKPKLAFDPVKFRKELMDTLMVEGQSFGDAFAQKNKEAAESRQTILGYLDQQIEKTREILGAEGEGAVVDGNRVTALQRLLKLLEEEKQKREEIADAAGEKKPEPRKLTFSDAEQMRADYDLQVHQLDLDKKRLETKDLYLEASGRTVGSLRDEAEAIQNILHQQEAIVRAKMDMTKMEEDFGLISGKQAREQELKDAQELQSVLEAILNLKHSGSLGGTQGFFDRLSDDLDKLIDKTRSVSGKIADVIANGIGKAIDTVSDGIWQLIDGTATWGDLFRQVGREIISSLIKIAIQEIFLDALKKGIMIAWKALTTAFRKTDVAEANATELQKTPALAANATLSSISSWGIAVAIGVAAIAAILASIGAFQEGGVVQGGRQLIQVNESGREAVLNARATAMLGESAINDLNSGRSAGLQASAASRSFAPDAERAAAPATQHILLVDSRNAQAARDFLVSSGGRSLVAEVVRDMKTEIGYR